MWNLPQAWYCYRWHKVSNHFQLVTSLRKKKKTAYIGCIIFNKSTNNTAIRKGRMKHFGSQQWNYCTQSSFTFIMNIFYVAIDTSQEEDKALYPVHKSKLRKIRWRYWSVVISIYTKKSDTRVQFVDIECSQTTESVPF